MKKTIIPYLAITTSFSSCIFFTEENEDDGIPEDIEVELTKEFLINERWRIAAIFNEPNIDFNGDGNKEDRIAGGGTDIDGNLIVDQVVACEEDNRYVFDMELSNNVLLDYGDLLCMDEVNQTFEYTLDTDKRELVIPSAINNFSNADGNLYLYNVVFYDRGESTDKIIGANYIFNFDGIDYKCRIALIN